MKCGTVSIGLDKFPFIHLSSSECKYKYCLRVKKILGVSREK